MTYHRTSFGQITEGEATTKDASILQTELNRRGFNVGTVDGIFGDRSRAALNAALAAAGQPATYAVASDRRSVTFPSATWAAVVALPIRSTTSTTRIATSTSRPPASAPPSTPALVPALEVPAESGMPWGWILGGVALAGAGIWFYTRPVPGGRMRGA